MTSKMEKVEEKTSSSGVQAFGEKNDWKAISRENDPVLSAIMSIIRNDYCGEQSAKISSRTINSNLFINQFMKFIDKNKMNKYFNYEPVVEETKVDKKSAKKSNKKGKNTIAEDIMINTDIKMIETDLDMMSIDTDTFTPLLINAYRISYTKFFYVIFWAIHLSKKKEFNSDTLLYNLLNCVISLSRAIDDNKSDFNDSFMKSIQDLLDALKAKLVKKSGSIENIYKMIFYHSELILESYWDNSKPKSIDLYPEQKTVIEKVLDRTDSDKSLLLFYKVPPGNGKTMIAAPLAEALYKQSKRGPIKKFLLYICYNKLVRNDVSSICNGVNCDMPFWLATSDMYDGKMETLLRPYRNCFDKFKTTRKKILESNDRFADVKTQWEYYMDITDKEPYMIISDLVSAHKLLEVIKPDKKLFPYELVVYFDEAFAGADQEITSQILKELPRVSILVSATLPNFDEVPKFIQNFESRYPSDEETTVMVDSTAQHISCTFVDPDGNVYLPHYFVKNLSDLKDYVDAIRNDPIKIRGYSPKEVYNMVKHIEHLISNELHFEKVFPNYGNIKHQEIRNYAMNVLDYVAGSGNEELFALIVSKHKLFMNRLDNNNFLTSDAHYYQDGNTLGISSQNDFYPRLNRMTNQLFNDSPKMNKIIEAFDKASEARKNQIESLEKGIRKDNKDDIEFQLSQLASQSLRLNWPNKYIVNSKEHGKLYGRAIYNENLGIKVDIHQLKLLEESNAKALLSGIGIYNPDEMNTDDKSVFMEYKDEMRFILSTPAIIYGTNMNISNVDIDESYSSESTRNSIYQLIGRAGRKGRRSYSAMAVFKDWGLLSKIMNITFENVEAKMIENMFES